MTLDEAIKQEQEKAKISYDCANKSIIKHIKTIFTEQEDNYKQVVEWLKELKQLREQTRWISVSERLPEIHQDVLLSLRSLNIEVGFRAKTEPYFYCHGTEDCYIESQNVIAWMPLPEPYKAEDEEE